MSSRSSRPSRSRADATTAARAAHPAAHPAIAWLLASEEPAIRGMTRRDVLGEPAPPDLGRVLEGPLVRGLLAGQRRDGGWTDHPYRKWTGAHWRLVSLVELAVPAGEPQCMAALDRVLTWLTARGRLSRMRRLAGGLPLSDASIEGNALAVACRLGVAADRRAAMLAEALVAWQWPDGGWNCDASASGRRSSFHESLAPMWGLHEYAAASGDAAAVAAADRAAELFLAHRIFRRGGTGEPVHRSWVVLHYPPYWHYDALRALDLLGRMGRLRDARCADALDLVERRRRPDGRWQPGAYWWNPPDGPRTSTVEAVDWGRGGPNEMLTLVALRVLRGAGLSAGRG